MKTKEIKRPSTPPKEYWEDSKWAIEHSTEISQQYPNQWVAVVDKKVVAASKDGGEAERGAMEKAGQRDFVIFFAEKGIHVYKNKAGF